MTAVMWTESLDAGYHGHAVIHSVELSVQPGEIVALLGANGAGKSTTLRAVAGLIAPLAGQVFFDDRPLGGSLAKLARRGLGYVPEERSIFTGLSVRENIRLGRASVGATLEHFPELEGMLNRRAGLLSGGEQQMLALGRALSRKPKVLLADELSLGLAPRMVRRLLRSVRAAADDGLGVLLVEQHVRQALRIADRAYVMRRGRVVLEGSATDVVPRIENAYFGEEQSSRAASAFM